MRGSGSASAVTMPSWSALATRTRSTGSVSSARAAQHRAARRRRARCGPARPARRTRHRRGRLGRRPRRPSGPARGPSRALQSRSRLVGRPGRPGRAGEPATVDGHHHRRRRRRVRWAGPWCAAATAASGADPDVVLVQVGTATRHRRTASVRASGPLADEVGSVLRGGRHVDDLDAGDHQAEHRPAVAMRWSS